MLKHMIEFFVRFSRLLSIIVMFICASNQALAQALNSQIEAELNKQCTQGECSAETADNDILNQPNFVAEEKNKQSGFNIGLPLDQQKINQDKTSGASKLSDPNKIKKSTAKSGSKAPTNNKKVAKVRKNNASAKPNYNQLYSNTPTEKKLDKIMHSYINFQQSSSIEKATNALLE